MRSILLLLFAIIWFHSCDYITRNKIHPEFEPFFEQFEVDGAFLLYDFQKNTTHIYNKERCMEGFLPASTFKIVNTLIGLETEIITDENFVIPWDSVPRQVPAWNRDHNLASAFQNSVVPWYQELARRIGLQNMKKHVVETNFGEMDITSENLDLFWLTGNSRITPFEQLDFQRRLVENQLPFQQKNIDLVKQIMILEKTPAYTLRGKSGWAVMNNKNIGWLVGYFERGSSRYAYVINVESEDEDSTLFRKSRKEIVLLILKELSLL